ncbi:MAG: isoprenylcysteine carboxylmethyltransferase family protein [Hymenobacter sp.]
MVLLLLGWLGYYALHSVLATTWLKAAVAARWPGGSRYYRLGYNGVAVVLFGLLMAYQHGLPARPLWAAHPVLTALGWALLAGGLLVSLLALRGYNLAEFGGWGYLRQGGVPVSTELSTYGLNARVRHPLYTGLLLLLLGYVLAAPTLPRLIFAGCSALYVLVGARLEEHKLLAHFGAAYARYRAQVPMLLPRLGRRRS